MLMQDSISVRRLFSEISRRYDLANHLLSAGLDYTWRARVVKLVRSGRSGRILDLATGSGDLALALRKGCPEAQIVAVDFCQPMLLQAKRKGLQMLVNADGTRLPFHSQVFDVVTVAFGLRNMESWSGALKEMARVLVPGGRLLILDFSLPNPGWFRGVYRFYLHCLLPAIASWITGNREAYRYLGESIEQFPSGQMMTTLLKTNGFEQADARTFCFGIVSLYRAQRA